MFLDILFPKFDFSLIDELVIQILKIFEVIHV